MSIVVQGVTQHFANTEYCLPSFRDSLPVPLKPHAFDPDLPRGQQTLQLCQELTGAELVGRQGGLEVDIHQVARRMIGVHADIQGAE